jgi:hypothetical protein
VRFALPHSDIWSRKTISLRGGLFRARRWPRRAPACRPTSLPSLGRERVLGSPELLAAASRRGGVLCSNVLVRALQALAASAISVGTDVLLKGCCPGVETTSVRAVRDNYTRKAGHLVGALDAVLPCLLHGWPSSLPGTNCHARRAVLVLVVEREQDGEAPDKNRMWRPKG